MNESCYCGEDAVDKGSKSSSSLCIVMYFVPTVSCFNSAFSSKMFFSCLQRIF